MTTYTPVIYFGSRPKIITIKCKCCGYEIIENECDVYDTFYDHIVDEHGDKLIEVFGEIK